MINIGSFLIWVSIVLGAIVLGVVMLFMFIGYTIWKSLRKFGNW
jgi:hypothetical protein